MGDVCRGLALGVADVQQSGMLDRGKRAQGFFLTARHGRTPSRLDANDALPFSPHLPAKANANTNDPLAC